MVQCYKLTIRRIVVDVNILYLRSVNTYPPCLCSRLFPSMESGHNSYFSVFLCTFRLSSFFYFFFPFSFIHFSSFNVIATPLLRSVSRIKIFLKSRSIRERSEFGRETNRFVINWNKLQLERTSCLSLSFFIEFLKQMDRRNICHKFVIKFLPILRRICSGVTS